MLEELLLGANPYFILAFFVLGGMLKARSVPLSEWGSPFVSVGILGTFLGIFIAYGFLNPLATNIEFVNAARIAYLRCIAECVGSFANGQAPLMAIEFGRRSLDAHLVPTADEMEALLKTVGGPGKK